MTTTVYVPENEINHFKGDCEAQGMGFSNQGATIVSLHGEVLTEFHLWHNLSQ